MNVSGLLALLRICSGRRTETLQQRHGRIGEKLAGRFLKRVGYRILARNWRSGRDELDLVALDGDVLVFVEVKARAADALVPGVFAVDARKKAALARAASVYRKKMGRSFETYRLDVVEVGLVPGAKPLIRHYENVGFASRKGS